MAKSLLVLTSQVTLNREQFQNQQRAMTVLLANHIPYETIDGADPVYKDRYVLVQGDRTSYSSSLRRTLLYTVPCNAA
jgi:hypothetical protein